MSVFPIDIWQKISENLNSDDLFSVSVTCKSAYKAFNRHCIQEKISWPLVKPKRLTSDQREVVQKMEKLNGKVKLICGQVGSGKSIVSLAYALRNNFDKVFLAVPPNLIKMWEKTCKTFFGISPLVLHNSNPKYRYNFEVNRTEAPEEKIILFSYIIFSKYNYNWIQNRNNDCLIVDEAHHYVNVKYKFKEIIALSATAFSRGNLSYGIRNLMGDSSIVDITFNLEKKIIASKLLPVVNIDPYKWKLKDKSIKYILDNLNPLTNGINNLNDIKWIPQVLTHTFIPNIKNIFLGGRLIIGKKNFFIPRSNWTEMDKIRNKYLIEHPLPIDEKKFEKYCEEITRENVREMIDSCVKYRQCLAILKYVKTRKEKTIIFDINVTYLPFLHKFLIDRGINSYIFSTHHEVTSRQKQLEKFKTDENADVLLSSVAMLGEGHNVTEANHIIFLTTMTDRNKYYQAIGRCWRYPQNKNVYIYNMFNSKLDEKIYESSYGKTKLIDINWEDALRN